jgi:hypothetical protein
MHAVSFEARTLSSHLRMTASPFVIAGLDPAIHLSRKKMDARIKSGHDD